jgi:hypothetical protein
MSGMSDKDALVSIGHEAYDAADLIGLVLNRPIDEWGGEDLDDVMRARDVVCAALVSVVALLGVGASPGLLSTRVARAIERAPEMNAVRAALRRGEHVPERELLAIYERAAREAEQ